MKLGLGSYAYRWSIGIGDYQPSSALKPVDLLYKAADLNVSLVQYADNMPLHQLQNTDVDHLAHEAQQLGIEIELGVQGLEPQQLLRYLELAQTLQAPLVRLALDAQDAAKPLPQLLEELRSVLPLYQQEGVRLAVENHFHFPSVALTDLILKTNHPALGICLDVGNSLVIQERPEETVALLAPHTINLHLKDYRIQLDPYGVGFQVTGTPLGTGLTDITGVLNTLHDLGREVNVILEQWMPKAASHQETCQLEDEWMLHSVRVARDYISD